MSGTERRREREATKQAQQREEITARTRERLLASRRRVEDGLEMEPFFYEPVRFPAELAEKATDDDADVLVANGLEKGLYALQKQLTAYGRNYHQGRFEISDEVLWDEKSGMYVIGIKWHPLTPEEMGLRVVPASGLVVPDA